MTASRYSLKRERVGWRSKDRNGHNTGNEWPLCSQGKKRNANNDSRHAGVGASNNLWLVPVRLASDHPFYNRNSLGAGIRSDFAFSRQEAGRPIRRRRIGDADRVAARDEPSALGAVPLAAQTMAKWMRGSR